MRDLTGQRFGALFVLGKADPHISPSGKKHSMWECRCECGKVGSFYTDHLVAGRTRSCGCLQGHPGGEKHPNYKHGQYKTRLYRIWQGMKHRCYCITSEDWDLYGGRGIGMCDEWRNDFSKFYEWAMENGYRDNLTIDRKEVNGNYGPDNCRWATAQEQCNNYRRNINISYLGETHTLMEWSKILKFPYKLVNQRITRDGKTFEEAIRL